MPMLRHLIVLVFSLQLTAIGGELLLGAAGQTSHQIVIPSTYAEPRLEESVVQAAELLQRAFQEQGIEITIVREGEATDSDRPGIYLGRTQFAKDQGIDFAGMEGWTYTWRVVGKNLIIAGNDRPDPMPLEKRRPREARHGGIPMLGTLKGTTEFLYSYAGVRFLQPGDDGIEFLPTPVLFVPDDLDLTRRTYGRNPEISRSNAIYTIANGLEPVPLALTNYGHFHQTAINPKSHGESNPEYFIWSGGKREVNSGHLCFSNPDVREIIYQKILEYCDIGYEIIELGQIDGFRPCSCEDCYELYGVHPTSKPEDAIVYLQDPAWGEKIWIMHRDMAERLLKDRPGHQLLLCAYSVARQPPTTISSFPANVAVQVMHPERELLEKWSELEVPGGLTAYIYTWGTFHLAGYTPLRTPLDIKTKAENLIDYDIRIIQNNGKPFTWGIEGINIYAWRRMMNDPQAKTIAELNDEYIEAAYREAAGPMRSFYRKIHQRLRFYEDAERYSRSINRNPLLLINTLWTPDLVNELGQHLSRAEELATSPRVQGRLAAARLEFDFLEHIARVVSLYHAHLTQQTEQSYTTLLEAVQARNDWLQSLMQPGSNRARSLPSFSYRHLATLKNNGRYLNVEPFNWDIEQRRAKGFVTEQQELASLTIPKTSQPVTLESANWEQSDVHKLHDSPKMKDVPVTQPTTFQVLYDNEQLYIRVKANMKAADMTFEPRGRDAEIWLQDCITISLSPSGDKSQYYYLNYEPPPNSFTDANHGFITDPLHPKFGWNDNSWNGDWTYETRLLPDQELWLSLVRIPFAALQAEPPRPGTIWMGNVSRVHFFDNQSKRELSVWAEEVNVSRMPGDAYFGEMIFE